MKILGGAILLTVVSFLGGLLSNFLFRPEPVSAEELQRLNAYVEVLQREGLARGDPRTPGAVLQLYAYDGQPRLQLGTYSGAYSKSEKGLPLIGLSDNRGGLRLLLRLAGRNESPVLVFKDKAKRDRLVIGLGLSDADEEPFIVHFDKDGTKHLLLGKY